MRGEPQFLGSVRLRNLRNHFVTLGLQEREGPSATARPKDRRVTEGNQRLTLVE